MKIYLLTGVNWLVLQDNNKIQDVGDQILNSGQPYATIEAAQQAAKDDTEYMINEGEDRGEGASIALLVWERNPDLPNHPPTWGCAYNVVDGWPESTYIIREYEID